LIAEPREWWHFGVWHVKIWFSRHGGVGLTVGLDDLRGLFSIFYHEGGETLKWVTASLETFKVRLDGVLRKPF